MKQKLGRPRTYKVPLTITLQPDTRVALARVSMKDRVPMSQIVERLIRKHLKLEVQE